MGERGLSLDGLLGLEGRGVCICMIMSVFLFSGWRVQDVCGSTYGYMFSVRVSLEVPVGNPKASCGYKPGTFIILTQVPVLHPSKQFSNF